MRKVEVKTFFIEGLKEVLTPRGFKAVTAKNMFVRKTDKVIYRYFFDIHDGYDVHNIIDGLDLRIVPIEELLKKVCLPYFPKWDKDGDLATVRQDYGWVRHGRIDYKYPNMKNPEEAEVVLNTVKEFLVEDGLVRLDRYSAIANIDLDFNDRGKIDEPPPLYYLQLGKYPDYRWRQTLVAKLCDNPVYDHLVEVTRRLFLEKEQTDVVRKQLDCYDGLVAYLESGDGAAELAAIKSSLLVM